MNHLKMQQVKDRFCLEVADGSLKLKEDHAYYYQVQLQMKMCQVEFAYFVLWKQEGLFIEKINVTGFAKRGLIHASNLVTL